MKGVTPWLLAVKAGAYGQGVPPPTLSMEPGGIPVHPS